MKKPNSYRERTFAMRISYQSTRGGEQGVTASQAILKGLACDGGLFMPTELPKLDLTMKELARPIRRQPMRL